MTAIEAIAVVFGVICVALTVKQNIWCIRGGIMGQLSGELNFCGASTHPFA